MAGNALQRRRLRIWEQRPTCAMCGRVVAYPRSFELDHIVPLWQGGEDSDNNCQLLCVHWCDGIKHGCHAAKTAMEATARANRDSK